MPRPLIFIGAALASAVQAPLSLDQAVTEAMAHATTLAAADAQADAAAARVVQARAAGLPTVTLSGSVGYGRLDPGGFFGLTASDVKPRDAEVTTELPLFAGGRIGAAAEGARAGRRAAEAARISARANLAVAVAEAYSAVLVAEEQRRLYERLAATTAELLRHAEDRFKVGDAPHTDVSQARARAAQARAEEAAAEGAIEAARARLANLIGRPPGGLEPLPRATESTPALDEAIANAEANSPAIAEATAMLDEARAAARGARAERLPTVGAFAQGSTVRDQFFPGYRGDSAVIGVRARWQLFDGGRVHDQITEADANVRAAAARLEAARDQVREALISAQAAVRSSALVEQAAQDESAAADEAVRNVRDEVKVGQKPQLDLMNADRDAVAAHLLALRARADRINATYRLEALFGRY